MRVPSGVNGRLSSDEPGAGPFAPFSLTVEIGLPFELAPELAGMALAPSTVPSARNSVTVVRVDGSSAAPGGSRRFPQPSPRSAKNSTGFRVIHHSQKPGP